MRALLVPASVCPVPRVAHDALLGAVMLVPDGEATPDFVVWLDELLATFEPAFGPGAVAVPGQGGPPGE